MEGEEVTEILVAGRVLGGPGDLSEVGEGETVLVRGTPKRDRDYGLWAGPLGLAVLRGASVKRLP